MRIGRWGVGAGAVAVSVAAWAAVTSMNAAAIAVRTVVDADRMTVTISDIQVSAPDQQVSVLVARRSADLQAPAAGDILYANTYYLNGRTEVSVQVPLRGTNAGDLGVVVNDSTGTQLFSSMGPAPTPTGTPAPTATPTPAPTATPTPAPTAGQTVTAKGAKGQVHVSVPGAAKNAAVTLRVNGAVVGTGKSNGNSASAKFELRGTLKPGTYAAVASYLDATGASHDLPVVLVIAK